MSEIPHHSTPILINNFVLYRFDRDISAGRELDIHALYGESMPPADDAKIMNPLTEQQVMEYVGKVPIKDATTSELITSADFEPSWPVGTQE